METTMLRFPLGILDTEYTADENSRRINWKGQHKEIIQIGLLALDHKLNVLESLRVYVRPRLNPVLSEYIKELTGIRQTDINGADYLPGVWRRVEEYLKGRATYSFGEDRSVIAQNFKLYEMKEPADCERIENIRPYITQLCREVGVDAVQYTSGTLCQAFGKKGERAHDALNDMKNLRLVLMELRSRGLL